MPAVAVSLLLAVGATFSGVPLVAIDPGHGGELEGALGVCGVKEKDVTLAIAGELARLLAASGRVDTLLTRSGDENIGLEERAAIANRAGADLFLSIHANASTTPESHGVETYFLSRRAANRRMERLAERENDGRAVAETTSPAPLDQILAELDLGASHVASQRLAINVQQRLSRRLDAGGRGVLQAPFVVLLESSMPAVLVEVGFLTHPEECTALGTVAYQRRIAQSLAIALLTHLAADATVIAGNL